MVRGVGGNSPLIEGRNRRTHIPIKGRAKGITEKENGPRIDEIPTHRREMKKIRRRNEDVNFSYVGLGRSSFMIVMG